MKLVMLDEKYVGKELANHIYNENGLIFLSKGKFLTELAISRMKKNGVATIYIKDDSAQIQLEEMISSETKNKLLKQTKQLFQKIRDKQELKEVEVVKIVEELVKSVTISENAVLINNLTMEDNLFKVAVKSVNALIYAMILGNEMNYHADKFLELSIATFLSNIGEFVNGNGSDTQKAREFIKANTNFGPRITTSVLQSKENEDGSGPLNTSGTNIFEYAKIIRICSDYVELLDEAKLPHEVIEILMAGSGKLYDAKFLNLFVKAIYCYPNGMQVKLNNGASGIIVKQNKSMPTRPVIYANSKVEIDLQKELTLFIEEIEF